MDLKHTCGYVTLLRTGKPSQNHYTKPRLKYPFMARPQTITQITALQKPLTDIIKSDNSEVSNSDISVSSNSPRNGIKDSASAEVLASELDSLDAVMEAKRESRAKMTMSSPSREKMKLDFTSGSTASDQSIENDWVMLDCCFGIPLFHADVNRQVCDRIASQGLFIKDR